MREGGRLSVLFCAVAGIDPEAGVDPEAGIDPEAEATVADASGADLRGGVLR
jgi:hypothetical protein